MHLQLLQTGDQCNFSYALSSNLLFIKKSQTVNLTIWENYIS